MNVNLLAYLKHEEQLLKEIVVLAEKQQKALIKYDAIMLEEIVSYQNVMGKSLRKAEENRINLLVRWLGISVGEASKLKLSAIEKHFEKEELKELKKLRVSLRSLVSELNSLNNTNRVLTNRARMSVGEMISHFTNGRNYVCNVKV